MNPFTISRRDLLRGLGLTAGGLAIGVRLGDVDARTPTSSGGAFSPNPFVYVAPDGTVTIVCHRSEMGQGIRSSMPALLAAELGADPARVVILQADGDEKYGDQNTDGSSSVRGGAFEAIRGAGATARVLLAGAAAARWRVREADVRVHDHAVHHPPTRRTLGFGELVADARKRPLPKPAAVVLRPLAELKGIGGELPHVDALDHVTGRGVFGADVRVAGMLTAVIARPPVVGGSVKAVDDVAARAVPGVRAVITLPALGTAPPMFRPLGGVAVVADHTWAALRGRAALAITWDHGANAGYDSAAYKDALTAAVRAPGRSVRNLGDAEQALAGAARRIEAEYHTPHLVHAPMEPPAAVARFAGGKCEVWASTQNPQSAQAEVARALGIKPADVTVHVTLLGGGFGRKSKPDYCAEAALLSREAGAPVRVQWTREDEIRHAYYHSCSAQRLEAGLDAAGKVIAWRHRTAFPTIGSTFAPGAEQGSDGELMQGVLDVPLAVPNVRCENGKARAHVRIGWLRSVHNINHAFAIHSFLDEIAAAVGRDPRDVMLEIFGPPRIVKPADAGVAKDPNYGEPLDKHPVDVGRLRTVIERVTERADWTAARARGRALGLAAHRSFASYVAVVVAVVKDRHGKIKVDEAWVSVDAGQLINADRVRAQMEGAVIFGASLALHGAITARAGAIEQTNFRDHPILRMNEAPSAIHVDLVPSTHAPGGVGEPGVPPVAPAIMNAVFALTGTRVRELPLRRHPAFS